MDQGFGANPLVIENNTFVGNANVLDVNGTAVRCQHDLAGGIFRNNIMWLAPGAHISGCASAPISYSDHENGPAPGVGNISMDPMFVDLVDYALDMGSPCIDAGDPAVVFNDPDGTTNDMGRTGGPLAGP